MAARKKRPVIGVVVSSEGNAFFDEVLHGMQVAAKEYAIYGLQIKYFTMKGYDAEKQLKILNGIQADINALIINPINEKSIADKINEMVAAGIFVVTVNNDIDGTKRHCYVGSDYYNGGITACALLEALFGKKADIAVVLGNRNILGHSQRLAGFRHRMERIPAFRLVETIENNDDDILAYETTKQLLEKHPGIDAISILAAGVYGVCRAVMQLPEAKRPLVIAFDTVPTTVEMMRFGIIKATIYQHPYRQGHSAVNRAFEYLVNGRLPEKDSYVLKNEIKLYENL